MSQNLPVSCAIPRAGRTFENFLNRLKQVGVDAGELDRILAVSQESKKLSSADYGEAARFLHTAMVTAPVLGFSSTANGTIGLIAVQVSRPGMDDSRRTRTGRRGRTAQWLLVNSPG